MGKFNGSLENRSKNFHGLFKHHKRDAMFISASSAFLVVMFFVLGMAYTRHGSSGGTGLILYGKGLRDGLIANTPKSCDSSGKFLIPPIPRLSSRTPRWCEMKSLRGFHFRLVGFTLFIMASRHPRLLHPAQRPAGFGISTRIRFARFFWEQDGSAKDYLRRSARQIAWKIPLCS